jgi:putative ABC transport system permease protein
MNWIAWRMLTGDRPKYLAIIFGIAFCSLLIGQQFSIFCGVMRMTTGQIRDIEEADLWVLAPRSRYVDDLKPLSEGDLERVRGIPGVAWAVRLYKGASRIHLPNGDFQQVILLGLDDTSLIGGPRDMLAGRLDDLDLPDAFVIDQNGYQLLWPDEPYETGKVLEMNNHRAVLVGVCRASLVFQTPPIVYTRFSQALQYMVPEEKTVSVILAQQRPEDAPGEVCRRIHEQTGLQAMTRDEFAWMTMEHYLRHTGLLLNFGTTVLLGFFVGIAVAGQNFYLFTVENLRYFGTLKAMGASTRRLVAMVMLQALVVGLIGYGIGVGLAALFGELVRHTTKLVFYMPWQVLVGTGAAVILILLLSSLVSIRRVLRVQPAIVFRV